MLDGLGIHRDTIRMDALASAAVIGFALAGHALLRRNKYGREVMEWFSQKTSIAGIQISNWVVVLGAIIVILILYRLM